MRQSQAPGYDPALCWHTFTPGLLHGIALAMHSTCLPSYSPCKCQDLRPCPSQGWQHRQPHSRPALPRVTALVHSPQPQTQTGQESASTHSRALPHRHIAQHSWGVGTNRGVSGVVGASRRPGCSRAPSASQSISHQHCHACGCWETPSMLTAGSLAAPKQHMLPSPRGCCGWAAAHMLLSILSSPEAQVTEPRTQGCLGSRAQARPIHLFRGACCHPSPAPSSPHGFMGVPLVPTTHCPPLTHLS